MTKILCRYRDLTPGRRRAAAQAALLVSVLRAALAVLPFRHVLRIVDRISGHRETPEEGFQAVSQFDKDLAVWAVEAAGRRILHRNPCLPQALAVLVLFRRAGANAELRVGVTRDQAGALQAHAWVESDGRVVVGGDVPVDQYTRLQGLEAKCP